MSDFVQGLFYCLHISVMTFEIHFEEGDWVS